MYIYICVCVCVCVCVFIYMYIHTHACISRQDRQRDESRWDKQGHVSMKLFLGCQKIALYRGEFMLMFTRHVEKA
jgi:hypothetical protein